MQTSDIPVSLQIIFLLYGLFAGMAFHSMVHARKLSTFIKQAFILFLMAFGGFMIFMFMHVTNM